MLAGLLDHCKAEYPHYKRAAKRKLENLALDGSSKAGRIKNEYLEAWKTDPYGMAVGTIAGIAITAAVYYRHQAKRLDKGSWVELLPAWEDAMLDRGAVLGMVIDGGQLRAKVFEREETKY